MKGYRQFLKNGPQNLISLRITFCLHETKQIEVDIALKIYPIYSKYLKTGVIGYIIAVQYQVTIWFLIHLMWK